MSCECGTHRQATAVQFGREKAEEELATYRRAGPGLTTRGLLAGLRAANAKGTLLDIGSGSGALTLELLEAGVSSATCVDISAGSLEVAREEAERRQRAERIVWQEGDFVEVEGSVPSADIVTLDKVVCCYPSYRELLQSAAQHSRRWVALSFPRDRWYVRAGIWLENAWRRLRGNAFRAFVHPVEAMKLLLEDAGFAPVRESRSLFWQMGVYERRG